MGRIILLAIFGLLYLVGYDTPLEKHLAIYGLLACLVGTIVIFFSIMPYKDAYEDNENNPKKSIAFIKEGLAELGIFFIFIGFLLQLISVWLTKNG